MPDFLRDQIWQFVGVVLAVLALCVTVVLYLLQRRRKALTYNIVSSISLISHVEGWERDLQIVFGGQQVHHVYLLLIEFANSGNQPIESNDYERPLTLSVEAPARVLTAQVVETHPSNLSSELLSDGSGGWCSEIPPELALDSELGTVSLRPVLLNSDDSFAIKMLVSQFTPGCFGIDARIVGVKNIAMAKESSIRGLLRQWIWFPILIVVCLLVELAKSPQPIRRYIGIIGFIIGTIYLIIDIYRSVRGVWRSIQRRVKDQAQRQN
jgi:hypothetical protein